LVFQSLRITLDTKVSKWRDKYPLKNGVQLKFNRVLDDVFSTWSHVAVMRALYDSRQGVTGRETARISGMNHRACLKALTELEGLAIVRRQRGGRDHLFSLNRKHVLVERGVLPILGLEREFPKTLFVFLKKHLGKHVDSLIVFGSVARKEETAESDLDLCLVVEKDSLKSLAQDAAHEIAGLVLEEFGARLSPLMLSRREFAERAKRGLPPVKQILKDGLVIAGTSMRGLTVGKS
jgi:predicted nucleotidyltransferase